MNELQSFLKIGSPRILVVGDLILDRYTWGNADRVSPEAPVLVLQADQKEVLHWAEQYENRTFMIPEPLREGGYRALQDLSWKMHDRNLTRAKFDCWQAQKDM